jgi:hypothetical protein
MMMSEYKTLLVKQLFTTSFPQLALFQRTAECVAMETRDDGAYEYSLLHACTHPTVTRTPKH